MVCERVVVQGMDMAYASVYR